MVLNLRRVGAAIPCRISEDGLPVATSTPSTVPGSRPDLDRASDPAAHAAAGTAAAASFEVRDVEVRVDGRTILEVPELEFRSGTTTGMIGPNGAGKTTFLKLMARQEEPGRGTVRFDGRSLGDWGDREFARRVAYLPQEPPAATGLTVEELVALGRYPWHGPLGSFGEEDRTRVRRALDRTDVARFSGRLVETLSGGERQRAWLAMLLAQDTDYLLLDEPTSALDVAQQVEVMRLIRSLSRDEQLGVVVVLHDVNNAARFCGRLVALDQGRVVAEGRPEELVENDVLESIYGVDMGILRHPSRGYPISYVQ